MNLKMRRPWICLATSILWLIPGMSIAQNLTIDPPGERAFVQDLARMVQPDDVMAIRAIGEKLLTEQAIPIIVVTIDSMAQHGGAGWRIETFARVLFDQWGIGYETIEGQPWNRGVLLLVSKDDRKARIELGNDWAGAYDPICRKIMDNQIIPNFKKGKYSEGILAGVRELDKMCRSIPVPAEIAGGGTPAGSSGNSAQGPSSAHGSNLSLVNRDLKLSPPVRPDWYWPAVGVTVFLAIFTAVSMIRSGTSGWAWALWTVVFGVLGVILFVLGSSSRRHYGSRGGGLFGGGGGGFSGGSFGGGFGGGGGATGSW
ncbi:MAG: TPM domain-containing protein [Candidatus Hydrogenedentes bacterium]|nr:TPM domain-containing protein [Candidatus Hydrogenedentota bacterium]